jgi:hemolysin III
MRAAYAGEVEADLAVHVVGTIAGVIGAAALLALAASSANPAVFLSVLVYSGGLVAMLVFSATYHLHRSSGRRGLLRRLDHAAIFVMIAGTYTPFTLCALNGPARLWSTAAMWLAALAGIVLKLAGPHWPQWASTVVYLLMGWAVIILGRPLFGILDGRTLLLLVAGGVLYSAGASIHGWRRLPFHDAIWHGLVVVAAGLHYAAILDGVVRK